MDTSTSKPAVIFRIAAKNEKGYGPVSNVLSQTVNSIVLSIVSHSGHTSEMAAGHGSRGPPRDTSRLQPSHCITTPSWTAPFICPGAFLRARHSSSSSTASSAGTASGPELSVTSPLHEAPETGIVGVGVERGTNDECHSPPTLIETIPYSFGIVLNDDCA